MHKKIQEWTKGKGWKKNSKNNRMGNQREILERKLEKHENI